MLLEKPDEAATPDSVVCSGDGGPIFVVVGSCSSGVGMSFVDVLDG
jgi:hypothetical protein